MNKKWQKMVKALQMKKYRYREGLFMAEGEKVVAETLKSAWPVEAIFFTEDFALAHRQLLETKDCFKQEVSAGVLQKAGTFASSTQALAVVKMRQVLPPAQITGLCLALDNVRDPGNLGTIIRLADWFGVQHVVCSETTADCYNPKVVAASMGSLLRVPVSYTGLPVFLNSLHRQVMAFGTFMSGENIHQAKLQLPAVLVMGNESAGISDQVARHVQQRLTIPGRGGAESLNVAMACAITCDNFFRQT